jgi:RsmE family RNA methyltransferase
VTRRLWAQVAALGVGRLMLTNAARVERNYFDTHVLAPESYRPLLIDGLQQAQDTWLPAVSIHRQFKVLVEDELDGLCPDARRIVAHPGAENPLVDACRGAASLRVLLAVGPEGGWNQYELELLEAHGFIRASLGPRTLRSDTATIALLAIVHAAITRVSSEP